MDRLKRHYQPLPANPLHVNLFDATTAPPVAIPPNTFGDGTALEVKLPGNRRERLAAKAAMRRAKPHGKRR